MSEYEQVEGMSVGQVVQSMSEGVDFYRYTHGSKVVIDTGKTGILLSGGTATMDLGSLRMELNDGHIYTRKEKPWWEGCIDCFVMARDREDEEWSKTIFVWYDNSYDLAFGCIDGSYKQARPLTTAERDAIKVQD